VTNHWANDVDPSWSNDGKKIIFISDRAGRPMVFEKAIDGSSSPRRITYAGRYNATPSYSPTGNYIVFTSMETNEFNLFLVTPNGKKLERLTKNQGSNEDPHFSPNGQFVVYSKKQGAKRVKNHRIYIMDIRGATEKQVTFANLGNCTQPRWSRK
jgi:TolB protein